jgi:hypothetical protein
LLGLRKIPPHFAAEDLEQDLKTLRQLGGQGSSSVIPRPHQPRRNRPLRVYT